MPKLDDRASVPLVDGQRRAKIVAALKEESAVRLGFLFGSQARNEVNSLSDIDVAVLIAGDDKQRFEIGRDLGIKLRHVLKTNEVDLVELTEAPPAFARAAVGGDLLLERDAVERTRFVEGVLLRYMDTNPLRQELLAGLKTQLGIG